MLHGLTHFQPMFHFYTPWKHQKTGSFIVLVSKLYSVFFFLLFYLESTNFRVYLFSIGEDKSYFEHFTSTYFCKWQVFENFKFMNFSPKGKRIRKRQLNQVGHSAKVSVKINGTTGRSLFKNCCFKLRLIWL